MSPKRWPEEVESDSLERTGRAVLAFLMFFGLCAVGAAIFWVVGR